MSALDSNNSNTHLTREERKIIKTGIEHGSTKTAIGQTIGKDNSTVGKEIKLHRVLRYKFSLPLECANYKKCQFSRKCTDSCPDYVKFKCTRRDRSPGACNGCSNYSHCRFDKYIYDPDKAQNEYEKTLVNSRVGYNITPEEAKELGEKIQPLLKQGLSPYAILHTYPDLGVSEKTLYTYIENGVFRGVADIGPLDLRRQVNRKITKKASASYKKREDRRFLNGRTYRDFKTYIKENPETLVTQMDTVYNDVTNGPFLQTFKFVNTGILFSLLHNERTAAAMTGGVDQLEDILGAEVFRKYVSVLLTDRGTEFSAADAIETDGDGLRRTRVYYCDPMQSGQKGSLENNHIELRYILPKETDLKALGLVDQSSLNLVLSHVNSIPIEKFGGKSPLETTEFFYPDLYEKLVSFGIHKIPKESIILKPYLLKNSIRKQQEDKKQADSAEHESDRKMTDKPDSPGISFPVDESLHNTYVSDDQPVINTDRDPADARRKKGRKFKKSDIPMEEVARLKAEGKTPKEIAALMGVSIATYYRRLSATK